MEQPECPLQLAVQRVARDAGGVPLSLRVTNLADAATPWQVVGAWVVAPDGTVRGYQRLEAKRAIAPGESRSLGMTLRPATTEVQPGDVVVLAVQESAGRRAWRRDQKALEAEARAVVVR